MFFGVYAEIIEIIECHFGITIFLAIQILYDELMLGNILEVLICKQQILVFVKMNQ